MEFIDMEHTPKNIIIKGIKSQISREQLIELYRDFVLYKGFFGIEPILEDLIKKYYKIVD
jgi:hypothetical protein